MTNCSNEERREYVENILERIQNSDCIRKLYQIHEQNENN